MADMTSVVNAILTEGSTEYQSRVPQATRDNITLVGDAILSLNATTEEFLNKLVNRIAMTIIRNKTFKNPLSVLKKGGLPLGNTVQELFTNPATANHFDGTGTDLLSRVMPDTKQLFHSMNRQDQYTVTFSKPQLKQAFTSWGALEELLNGVINSLYSGDNMDEFILSKNLIADAITNKKIKVSDTADITTSGGPKQVIKDLTNASKLMRFPSTQFNSYLDVQPQVNGDTKPVITWTPKEDQILIMRADIVTEINIEVLAAAFNMDKVALQNNILEIDDFGAATDTYAILADKAYFQIRDNLLDVESFYNPKGKYWNYYYNHWQTYSMSYFANAVAFRHPAV